MGINNIYLHNEYDHCPGEKWGDHTENNIWFTTSRCTYHIKCCRSCLIRANEIVDFIHNIDPVLEYARSIERYIREERKHMEKNFDCRRTEQKAKKKAFLLFRRQHQNMVSQLTNYVIEELGEYLFYQWEKGLRLKGMKI